MKMKHSGLNNTVVVFGCDSGHSVILHEGFGVAVGGGDVVST